MSLTIPTNLYKAHAQTSVGPSNGGQSSAIDRLLLLSESDFGHVFSIAIEGLLRRVSPLSILLSAPVPAMADIAGLIPCKESIKKLESSLKLYAPDSAPALAIQATIEKTKRRFAIGDEKKPLQKEIIIDVPLATGLVFRGFSWAVAAYRELLNGELIAKDV